MIRYLFATSAVVMLTVSAGANAAPIIYDDRELFIESVSPEASIDFNSETLGASFSNQSLVVGSMTLEGGSHYYDVAVVNVIAPGGTCLNNFSVDGSTHACGYVGKTSSLRVDFLSPVQAWGADFRDLGDEARQTALRFYDETDELLGEMIATEKMPLEKLFLGIDLQGSKAAYMLFDFVEDGNGPPEDAFGMDNVLFSVGRGDITAVPLPATSLLLGGALAGLVGLQRRSKNKT